MQFSSQLHGNLTLILETESFVSTSELNHTGVELVFFFWFSALFPAGQNTPSVRRCNWGERGKQYEASQKEMRDRLTVTLLCSLTAEHLRMKLQSVARD